MNKMLRWILVAVAIVTGLALPRMVGAGKKTSSVPAASVRNGKADRRVPGSGSVRAGPIAVSALVIRPQRLTERIVSPGTVLPNEFVEVKSEIAGRIVALDIREGRRASQGEILAKINDADLQAQLLKAKAALTLAQAHQSRVQALRTTEMATQEQSESVARDLESARADVALLMAQIEKTEIRAPFDGVVGLRSISPGAYVSPGTTIAVIVKDRPLKIEFSVPEKYAGQVGSGTTISLTTQGSRGPFLATVYAVDPRIDDATRTLRMRARCATAGGTVLPGSFAEVTVILGENDQAILVPSVALVPDATGQNVYRVSGGTASMVRVATGVRDSTMVQITDGLHNGDTIVTVGVLLLRPGAAVELNGVQ